MKYFKLKKGANGWGKVTSKIYPENARIEVSDICTIGDYVNDWPKDWQEVTKEEYDAQEGKTKEFVLPTKWCIKDCEEVSEYAANRFHCGRQVGTHYLCVNEDVSYYTFETLAYAKEEGYKKITKAQFKKYVLKESITEEVIEVLPEKWCVVIDSENRRILGDYWNTQSGNTCYDFDSGCMHSHNLKDQCIITKGQLDCSFHHYSRRGEYTKITFDQFQRLVLKKQPKVKQIIEPIKEPVMKNQAKTFKITSKSKALLEAMWKELLSIGYTEESYTPKNNYSGGAYISTNIETVTPTKTIEQFKELYCGSVSDNSDKSFNLPEQYNEAIEFAKEQLLDKYWVVEPEFKVDDYVIVLNNKANTGCNNSAYYKVGLVGRIDKVYGKSDTFKGQLWVHIEGEPHDNGITTGNLRIATPEEIKEHENNLLLEEAKKRYPKGTKFLNTSRLRRESDGTFTFDGMHIVTGGNYVWIEGKWADILDNAIEIKGYECKFESDSVSFGCQTFSKQTALDLVRLMDLGVIESKYSSELKEVAKHFSN